MAMVSLGARLHRPSHELSTTATIPSPASSRLSSGGWVPCHGSGACCKPHSAIPQYCPGRILCQDCGGANCQCPSGPTPGPPPPSPGPTPTPSGGSAVHVVNNCRHNSQIPGQMGQLVMSQNSSKWAPTRQTTWKDGVDIALAIDFFDGMVVGPGTMAEFSFTSWGGANGICFDISLIKGFDYPLQMNEYKAPDSSATGPGIYQHCLDASAPACIDPGNSLTITFCPDGPVPSTREFCNR